MGPSIALHLAGIPNPALTGLLISLFQGLGSVTQTLCRKLAFKRSILWGVLTVALAQVGFFVAASFHSPLSFLVATAFAGLGYGAAFVGAAGLTNHIAPAHSRVTVVSWFYMAGYIGGNAVPALAAGMLADAFGLYASLGIFSAIMLAAAIYILVRTSRMKT
jgi:MFS family permease